MHASIAIYLSFFAENCGKSRDIVAIVVPVIFVPLVLLMVLCVVLGIALWRKKKSKSEFFSDRCCIRIVTDRDNLSNASGKVLHLYYLTQPSQRTHQFLQQTLVWGI